MNLPAQIRTETELEDILARPSEADVEFARRLDGDVLIVGAGGKMGPSLARRVYRALVRVGSRYRVMAASRFSSAEARGRLEAEDIQTLACDLLEPAQIAALPRAENVLFLAGRKFGTLDRPDLTWITKDKDCEAGGHRWHSRGAPTVKTGHSTFCNIGQLAES
jgi:hypothetical protein